ncbi:MAG: UDP-N-acetylmuramoyl-L-alanyl-D-glutamate--2,6-diaminopimelate ligase [Bacteroidota bacterium]|jgi:UDP-N-acetylmuramoyl-L-alanyl-D-glutamate--2,6-diaminopimelate ligase
MKLLSEILYKAGLIEVVGSTNVAISGISFDSRKVKKDALFVAVRGTNSDGHNYIETAIKSGAIAIVCENFPDELDEKITYIKVKNSSIDLGNIASNFYENPSEKIKLVGVTGTNGKTTTVTLLFQLFRQLGYSCGLISTVRNRINMEEINATHTTPDAVALNELLRKMADKGCQYVFMEVSSHAVVQGRISGVHFSGAVFTNITHDHLDYHKTFEEYIKAKKGFFDHLANDAFALVNKDDKNAMVMLQNCKAEKRTFSLIQMADFKCKVLENHLNGLLLNIDGIDIWVKLIGSFNAYNVLGVYATAMMLKQDKTNVLTALSALNPVEGRFQHIKSESGIIGIVDYAHTPDALKNVLSTIKDIRTGNEEVITLVGCGGDRDSAKRPIMAKIAAQNSTKVILTSDNPRTENPETILDQMQEGLDIIEKRKSLRISDRKEAIRTACSLAKPGDIILIAGKGHEKYQEINGVKHPFDDLEVLRESLKEINS